MDGLSELLQELNVIIVCLLSTAPLSCRIGDFVQKVLILRGKVNVELKQSLDNLIDILVDSDQVVFNEVSLTEFDPLFSLLFLTLKLIDVVDVMVWLRVVLRVFFG